MSSRDSVLFALVSAAVGVAAGFLFASLLQESRPIEASAPRIDAAAVARPSEPADRASSLESPLEDEVRAPAAVTAATPTVHVSERKLTQALEAVAAPSVETPVGAGSITGKVVDAAGTPFEGAVIVATRSTPRSSSDPATVGAGAPEEQGLEDYLRERAESWAETRAGRQRVTTGPDGRFELTGLVENATYSLAGYLAEHVLVAEGSVHWVSPGQEVTFSAEGVHTIPVQVSFASGTQPADAVVVVGRGNQTRSYRWTPDSPELRLTPGHVSVRGHAGVRQTGQSRGDIDSTHASQEVSLDVVDQAGVQLELTLEARSGISGRVVDDFGTSAGHTMVRLLALPDSGELDEAALAESDRHVWLSGNRFHFLDLAPGTYAVGLSNWNNGLLAHALATLGEGVLEVDLVVPEPTLGDHLLVRAYGPTGNALRDLDFRWIARTGKGSRTGGLQGRRAADGAYWLKPKEDFFETWAEGSSYALTVQHAELGDREVLLEQGQREVEVTYEDPVTLVVVVAGYAGSKYVGKLRVSLSAVVEGQEDVNSRSSGNRSFGSGDGQFAANGVARFSGLAPGRWKVELQIGEERWRARTVQTAEVRASSGETTVPMDLPVLYELVVIAPELAPGTSIYLTRASVEAGGRAFRSGSQGEIDADGRVVFENLLAGDYSVRGGGITSSVDVTVPCGDLYLDEAVPDCLRVAIGDLEGAMYKAGLRAGDLIIAVDGVEFESSPNAWQVFQGSGPLPLTVLRAGQSLELTLERVESGDWFTSLGGMLTPASRP